MRDTRLKFLLVEDESSYAVLLEELLRDSGFLQYELVHAKRMSEAEERLAGEHFDVVLLDLTLPDSHGLSTYTRVKTLAPSLPVVLLTGNDDEKLAFQAVREGAQDYLVKGQLDGKMLLRAIRYAIERKRAEEELRESEEFFRLISENVTDLIAVIDRDGKRLYCSPSYKPLLGDPTKLPGTDSFEEIHPEDHARVRQIFQGAIRSGVGQRTEYRLITRSGRLRHIESQLSAIRDAAGKPSKVVVVSRDITERKEAVGVLRQALSDLKASHEQLQATQLQLIQSERLEAVSTFASGVAHEVKNPLQTVILGIDYLSHHFPATNAEATMVLSEMGGAVQRADAIIRGLLEFSIQNKREVKEEDLNAIVEHALRAVEHELIDYPIRVIKQLAPDVPLVRLDARTMKHVFINLLLYCIRAMAEGGELAVRTSVQPLSEKVGQFKAGETVVIAEVETIRAADSESHANSASDSNASGHSENKPGGLGINVLKKIVELSGGAISIASQGDGGNRYAITFKPQREEEKHEKEDSGHR